MSFVTIVSAQEQEELFASCDEEEQGVLDYKGVQKLGAAIYSRFSRFGKVMKGGFGVCSFLQFS